MRPSLTSENTNSNVPIDKVQMYEEEIMTNDDNLESSIPTSNLLNI